MGVLVIDPVPAALFLAWITSEVVIQRSNGGEAASIQIGRGNGSISPMEGSGAVIIGARKDLLGLEAVEAAELR
jgi:hypothetical protein